MGLFVTARRPICDAQRLLGWLTREVEVISTTQVRRRVQHHGALIRQAEQAEVQALLEGERLSDWHACLAPLQALRRPAAWDDMRLSPPTAGQDRKERRNR